VKLKFKLSRLALQDIDGIWTYTAEQWSKAQANNYYKTIFKEIEQICINPQIGKSIHQVKVNHRLHLVKTHVIIYKTEKEVVYIDRVLHQRMDIDNLLKE